MTQSREDRDFVIYDNHCSMCTLFARYVGRLTGGRVRLVGHYSRQGSKMRDELLDSDALEMFWFVDKSTAYGGRAAILPLLRNVVTGWLARGSRKPAELPASAASRDTAWNSASCQSSDCSGPKDVFIRSASIIRNSRVIQLNRER